VLIPDLPLMNLFGGLRLSVFVGVRLWLVMARLTDCD
jgi:hypothetical protein